MSAVAQRVTLCDGCGEPIEGRLRLREENFHDGTCRSRARRRRLQRGNGEPVEDAAMLLRADWVRPLVRAGELDGEEALFLVVAPSPELRLRSERAARKVAA